MPTSPQSCAPDDALAALARGELAVAGPWVEHIDGCPTCRERFKTLIGPATATWAGLADLTPTDEFLASTALDPDGGLARILGGAKAKVARLSETRAEAARLLRPPEGPDELGRLGPYRVLDVIGAGGMGIVLRAEEIALGRQVALKVMRAHLAADPVALARFQREARAMAAVEHDHVVPIYRVDADNGVPFVAMPLLAGEALSAAVRRDGKLAPGRVVELGRQIAAGLAAAHRRGLIHRDIKPANIWLEPRADGAERVRLLDFGLARAAAASDVSGSGIVIGTPAYMSPEQARGKPADHRTDLFSLGVVLYRMATGESPFNGEDHFAVARQVVELDPPAPVRVVPGLPTELSALIMRMMSKDPAARPSSAQEVADELARIAGGGRPARKRRVTSRWVGASPVLLLALIGLVLVLSRPWSGASDSTVPIGPPDPPPPKGEVLKLVRSAGADRQHNSVHAIALAHSDAGPVVLSEGYPEGLTGRGIHVWDRDLTPVGKLPSEGEYIRTLAATPDGKRFVTVGAGGLEVWEMTGKSANRVIPAAEPPASIGGIVVAPSGKRVYTTDYEDAGVVRAYTLTADALTPAGVFPEVLGRPWQIVVSPDGRWVGATAKAGKVCLWDTRIAGKPVARVLRATGPSFPVIAFSPDSKRAWVADGTDGGAAYDISGEAPKRTGAVPTSLGAGPARAAFADVTGRRLIVVGEWVIQLLDVTGETARVIESHEVNSPLRIADYDAKAGRLYTGHDDGVRLWEVAGP